MIATTARALQLGVWCGGGAVHPPMPLPHAKAQAEKHAELQQGEVVGGRQAHSFVTGVASQAGDTGA